jgi:uncharacterized phage protein (TIGR02218 family)
LKPASSALIALLNSNTQFIMADLFTFTLQGGTTLRYSAAMTAITDSTTGHVFALGPKFERSNTRTVIGTQVDELDVRLYPETTDLIGATPWLQAAWTGQLDGALLQLERAFMPSYGDTTPGTVVLFSGRVSDIDCSRTCIDIKCRSHLELLNIQMPRRLYQASCNHVFGDAMCQFNRASQLVSFNCLSGSTPTQINSSLSINTFFTGGSIIGITGANAGQTRTISGISGGSAVVTKLAFLTAPITGDTFNLLPGCDHSLSMCTSTWNNAIHFGGQPFIPTPENAV